MIQHLTPSHAYLLTAMLSNGAAPSGEGAATTGFYWMIVKCKWYFLSDNAKTDQEYCTIDNDRVPCW